LATLANAAVKSTAPKIRICGGGAHDSLGYPDNSLLTYTEWLYDRGFGSYQLGYASALAVVLFVVSAVLLLVAIRRIRVFNGKDLS